jgi:hypothetical protein
MRLDSQHKGTAVKHKSVLNMRSFDVLIVVKNRVT